MPQRSRSRIVWISIAIVVLFIGGWWWNSRSQADGAAYRTASVDRGTIAVSISATGSLSAITTVDVGAQVSGMVTSVLVDYNDRVSKGQIIARIDPSTFNAKLQQAKGQVAAAQAQLAQAQAGARNTQADYTRKVELGKRQLIARSDVDAALAARDQSIASASSGRAQIAQQQAAADSARLDLERSVIRSPVDGVVITRAVEPGQTVAASLQTPTLFQIAEDLRQMQIVLAVDEADIGQVKDGQKVRFNVDAFPDRDFSGIVKQVRLAATNTQNVITYPVVVTVNNDDLTLLPGMTVNAEIQISRHDNVLRVPNAALRYHPDAAAATGSVSATSPARGSLTDALPSVAGKLKLDATQQAAFDQAMAAMAARIKEQRAKREAAQGASGTSLFGRTPGGQGAQGGNSQGSSGQNPQRTIERMTQQFADFRSSLRAEQQQAWDSALQGLATQKRATIYKLVNGSAQAVNVRIGASDGSFTEISGDGLAEGDKVIVGVASADAATP